MDLKKGYEKGTKKKKAKRKKKKPNFLQGHIIYNEKDTERNNNNKREIKT